MRRSAIRMGEHARQALDQSADENGPPSKLMVSFVLPGLPMSWHVGVMVERAALRPD